MGFLLLPKTAERSGILGTGWLGYANCVSVFAPNGRLLFCTGKPGCTNCVSVFVPNGRRVFRLKSSEELRSAERGDSPYPRRGAQEGWTPMVSTPSCESPRFLLASACHRTETRQRNVIFRRGDQCVRPFLYLYAVSDTLLLHIRFSLRRRDTR